MRNNRYEPAKNTGLNFFAVRRYSIQLRVKLLESK